MSDDIEEEAVEDLEIAGDAEDGEDIEDLDEDELLADDLEGEDEDFVADPGAAIEGGDEEDEDDETEAATPAARKVAGDDEDDDEEVDPDDVEADLEEILRGRMATQDDEEDEEDGETSSGPNPVADGNFVCESCFLQTRPSTTHPQYCVSCVADLGLV